MYQDVLHLLADLLDRESWHCIDCGALIHAPHPMCPPFHYMCPVVLEREVQNLTPPQQYLNIYEGELSE